MGVFDYKGLAKDRVSLQMASTNSMRRIAPLLLLVFHLVGILSASLHCGVRPTKHSDGTVSFAAQIQVENGNDVNLSLDTTSPSISLSKCTSLMKSSKANFTFGSVQDSGFPGGGVSVSNVKVSCGGKKNVAGLASGVLSLPNQVWESAKVKKVFAYCLSPADNGALSFGRNEYRVYLNSDILFGRTAVMTPIPLKVGSSYEVELTGVGINSNVVKSKTSSLLQIGTSSRYTRLPSAEYSIIRSGVMQAAVSQKLRKESSGFGDLDLCYKMSSSQVTAFPNITMEFSKKAKWVVSPLNYLVTKSGATNVSCFAIVIGSKPMIGTFQQENNFVEYDSQNKTVSVSGSLIAQFQLGCKDTYGS